MYESRPITNEEYNIIINTIRNGYTDDDGIPRHPNEQVADILVLQANMGCTINDIVSLTTDSLSLEDGKWKLHSGQRIYTISPEAKKLINEISEKCYDDSERLFSVSAAAVWKVLRIVSNYLGLENISSHSFRKLGAINLYESSGHNLREVTYYLQNTSNRITKNYLK